MYNNGLVPSPPLNHTHLVNDINHCLGIGTQTLGTPLLQLELSYLLHSIRLHDHNQCVDKRINDMLQVAIAGLENL